MVPISMAVRSTSTRPGRNPKAAAEAAASAVAVAAVGVPAVVVAVAVVDRASAASPAGKRAPKQEVRRPVLRVGRRCIRSLSYGYAFAHIISETAEGNRPDGETAR